MKPSDGPNTQEIHEIPALHSLVPCNSLVSKLILKKTAKDQGCLGIKGATSPLSVMAQFSKETYLFFKLSRSKSKTPIIIFIYCAKVFKVMVNMVYSNIINKPTLSTFGPLGSGRLPETPSMPHASLFGVHNAVLNIYKSIAHRVPNKIIFSLLPILMQHCSLTA